MEAEIDQFILYLATERGLSENYQLSTRASLERLAAWLRREGGVRSWGRVELEHLAQYLGVERRRGLAAASLRL
ncbi:MAG: site-specific integrase, partial [Verrucomicrobiales bacterium]